MAKKTEWTMMIYANGNNDLEPEMWQAKLAVEKAGSSDKVKVVMQIGREEAALVNLLRPACVMSTSQEQWTGVRRYAFTDSGAVLLVDLGKKNMADPYCLYEFVKAAMRDYPAEHYMVALGGHGYQFVGSMTDYSQSAPCIMGFTEMAKALDMACGQGQKIDLLIADVCYFNFIEVIYEFTSHAEHGIQNVLTYICDGPITGMPYDQIMRITQRSSHVASPKDLVKEIIQSIDLDLVAFELNYLQLAAVKEAFHELADSYMRNKGEGAISLHEVLFVSNLQCPWLEQAQKALAGLEALIIDYKRITGNNYGLLNIANVPSGILKADSLYTKLKFAQGNAWTNVLSGKTISPESVSWSESDFSPIPLAPQEVYAYISLMNANLTKEQKLAILENVAAYKYWFSK